MLVIVLPEDKSSFSNSELKNAPFNFRKDNTCNSITQTQKVFGYHSKEILSIIKLKFSLRLLAIKMAISSILLTSKFELFNLYSLKLCIRA